MSCSSKASSSANRFNSSACSIIASSSRPRQHAQDDQHATRAGDARFDHLIRIDQKILAHRWHIERRQCSRGLLQVMPSSRRSGSAP